MKGKFITFEGGEGVGKSTQVRLLMEYLEKTSQPAVLVRQPGGTPICEKSPIPPRKIGNIFSFVSPAALLFAKKFAKYFSRRKARI